MRSLGWLCAFMLLPSACRSEKSAELLAAEKYERDACACATSACVRDAQRAFHAASRGQIGESESRAWGRTLSRAMGCGSRFVAGDCKSPDKEGCPPGYSCLPAVGVPPGVAQAYACWKD